jgi:hypothetical protein
MKKFLVLILIFSISKIYPSNTVWSKYGWQIFRQAGDARTIALGSSFSAGGTAIIDALWNPAVALEKDRTVLNYSHQSRFAGMISSDLISFPIKIQNRGLAVTLLHETIGHIPDTRNALLDWGLDGIPGTGDLGEANGILDEGERLNSESVDFFRQTQWGLHASHSWDIGMFRLGLAVKSLYHILGDNSSTGVGFDLGVAFGPWRSMDFGLTIHDFTTSWQVWDNGTVERFYPRITSGLIWSYGLSSFPINIGIRLDGVLNTEGRSLSDDFGIGSIGGSLRSGMEIVYDELIALRFGRTEIGVFTTGLGVQAEHLSIHYAVQFIPVSWALGKSHYISFSLDLDWFIELGQH